MTTYKQDTDFIDEVLGSSLLQESIEWIRTNLNPQDVFDEDQLSVWAENAGYVME